MKRLYKIGASILMVMLTTSSLAAENSTEGEIKLSYSNGQPTTIDLEGINEVLKVIGVRIHSVSLPEEAKPIFQASQERAINEEETAQLLSIFSLHRGELLEEIEQAGREPEAHRGGYLSTSEIGDTPYPKIYDIKALSPDVMIFLQDKLGKLHVNSAENGMGIDEVMTIVSGGPWTWFFLLPDNVIGKLTVGKVEIGGLGWRISYPGLVPHGAFLDAEHGLVVAHGHGPQNFVMRYEEPSIEGAELLGDNSWIDFSKEQPSLLD